MHKAEGKLVFPSGALVIPRTPWAIGTPARVCCKGPLTATSCDNGLEETGFGAYRRSPKLAQLQLAAWSEL
jgi:hypothetical protein